MRWDIFCKIVDNFGDIGVCWRLARQLEAEHGLQICLWIDDLHVAKQLIPTLDLSQETQVIQNITIAAWHADTDFSAPAKVVIEAFSCELPPAYLARMHADTVWVNLEYLSAEDWVEGFHLGNAKHCKLTRHYFFPGFTSSTGGLLRESDIVKNNQVVANNKDIQEQFLQSLGLTDNNRLKVSLFCYPHAPLNQLLEAMANSNQPVDCYVPTSSLLAKVADYFGKNSITTGETLTHKNLHLHVLPFLSQTDYDKLLATCDINFVRGEDSWIRAIWAGKPFIWQPYFQSENTHIIKLNAFLDLFYSSCDEATKKSTYKAHTAWVSDYISATIWQRYLNNLNSLKTFTLQQTLALAAQSDLATKLVIFSENLLKNKV